jgi:hypothetical protein
MVARRRGEVEAAHSECGHLAEPDACVGEEQDDEPVGLVLAFIEPAMLAYVRRASARLGEGFDLGVSAVAARSLRAVAMN